MVATASSYFKVMVEPTVIEFMDLKYDMRKGLLAALVLNQMADHLALEDKPQMKRNESQKFVDKMCNQIIEICPEFKFIKEIANVTKHSRLSVKSDSECSVTSIGQLSITPGLFQAPFGQGRFREACVVYAELDDGTSIPLHIAVEKVFNAWKNLLLARNEPTL